MIIIVSMIITAITVANKDIDIDNNSPTLSPSLPPSLHPLSPSLSIPHTFPPLPAPMPQQLLKWRHPPKGVPNRRAALAWIRKNAKTGVVYFADDDNTYDYRLFEEVMEEGEGREEGECYHAVMSSNIINIIITIIRICLNVT